MTNKERVILIVEDEFIVAEDIKMTLRKFNYGVLGVVSSAEAALKILKKGLPDLILMDINLRGDMNGVELADIIRKNNSLPIVYLTANADEKTMQQAKITQPFGYILKPFEERELHAIIEMAFYRFKIENKLRTYNNQIINLHKVAIKLASIKNRKDVYDLTINSAEHLLDFQIVALYIKKNDKMELILSSEKGEATEKVEFLVDFDIINSINIEKKTVIKNESDRTDLAPRISTIYAPIGDLGVFVASSKNNPYKDDDKKILELLLGYSYEALKRIALQKRLEKLAVHDSLTGVYNRHYLNQVLDSELKKAKRYNREIGFVMIDINDLKALNDNYGHQTGDFVIKEVADFLAREVRETDVIIRYGGDEFLIMLPETGIELKTFKQRLLTRLSLWNDNNPEIPYKISFSVGFAYWSADNPETTKEIIAEADKNMYIHKSIQKNRNINK